MTIVRLADYRPADDARIGVETDGFVIGAEADHASPKRRVAFIINSLAGGGAERTLVNLLSFSREELAGYDVHLVLLDRDPEHHQVDPSVRKWVLDAQHGLIASARQLYRLLRKIRPEVTVSFLNRSNCANILVSRLLGNACIISERIHTSSHFGDGMRGRLNKLIVRALYPRADCTVAVSRDVEQDLVENYGIPATKAITIGNPIDIDLIEKRSRLDVPFELPAEFIVGAGRLVPNKNFGLLIEAYRRSAVALPLVIMGDGPERGALANQVDKLGLGGRVIFPGYVANPYPVVRRAKFFVSSSNAEGFPNALVEAMALGCAVVATDCNAGPSEILNHTSSGLIDRATLAKYGVLVPTNDSEALAAGMHMMMDDAKRASLAGIARRRALDFRPDIVVKRYAELLAASLPHLTSPEPAKADALKAG